jgi:transposase InsO family protein
LKNAERLSGRHCSTSESNFCNLKNAERLSGRHCSTSESNFCVNVNGDDDGPNLTQIFSELLDKKGTLSTTERLSSALRHCALIGSKTEWFGAERLIRKSGHWVDYLKRLASNGEIVGEIVRKLDTVLLKMAQAQSYKVPPKLGPDTNYESWKNEVEMWRLVTDLEKKKQALAVALSLTGKAREVALEIDADELNRNDGLTRLLNSLDKVFEKEAKDLSYAAYTEFDKFRKRPDMSMEDYVIEFERLYNKCRKYRMILPDAILAFKLLDNSGLEISKRQMALTAASELTFKDMKSAMNRIFGANSKMNEPEGKPPITVKTEEALYTKRGFKGNYGNSYQNSEQSQGSYKQSNTMGGQSVTAQRGTNPLNRFGRRTRCAICQSVFHWAKNCPDKEKPENVKVTEDKSLTEDMESCNITLFNKTQDLNTIFMMEASAAAVIDTACTRTVCGEEWLENYEGLIENKTLIKAEDSQIAFRFGDGKMVNSYKQVVIPAIIAGKRCNIRAEVVKADIPLLLSKDSMKKAGTILDLSNDSAKVFGENVQLELTSSGHYCLNLRPDRLQKIQEPSERVLTMIDNMSQDDKKKSVVKMHRQFGHASAQRLLTLIKGAGNNDKNIQKLCEEVVKECETCVKFKKPSPKPAVGLPLATRFNETIAVDLHQLESNIWYLHIIDEFTRYSAGCIIDNKESSTFADKFMKYWIAIHGPPVRLYSDNGGEFNSEIVRDMAENFNIMVKTTPGYSPWSNGLLERHNKTLTEIMDKVMKSEGCDYELALSWALMAKNCLHNVQGFSPHQLVYGENPNLPSVLTDKPPALEGTTVSELIGKHISALHNARRAFTEAEFSDRIRRALRKNVRASEDNYCTGDKVYYKKHDSKEWKGPGTVIGADGMVVFVRHGGTYVRVHKLRLSRVRETEGETQEDSETESENTEQKPEVEDMQATDIKKIGNMVGKIIGYQTPEGPVKAKVISRAGKASGKNRDWFNLEMVEPPDMRGQQQSADISQLANLKIEEDDSKQKTEDVYIVGEEIFKEAKQAELQSWKQNEVYREVEDKGQKTISTRWICTMKTSTEGQVPKARLVARGFEESNKEQFDKDSPTCGGETLRMILAIFAQKGWKPASMDIKTAFLQGYPLSRDVFLRPPLEMSCKGKIWKLNKCVYGLSDASLQWYTRVKTVLISLGAKMSKLDPAVFYWEGEEGVYGILACHVDDFIWGGDVTFQNNVITKVRKSFNIGKEESEVFKYLGLELAYMDECIVLNQDGYTNNLTVIDIERDKLCMKDLPLNDSEKEQLRSKIGQVLWVARQTRPDVMYDVCHLAANYKNATIQDLIDINKVIKKIGTSKITLTFQPLQGEVNLVVFTDASFANLPDGATQGGYLILLMGEGGRFSPICWNSKRIRRVVRSTLAGETLALAEGIDMGVYLSEMVQELCNIDRCNLVCITDNKSLFEALKSNKQVSEKRLRLEISNIKDMLAQGIIKEVKWYESVKQLADCLTKKGASPYHLISVLNKGWWIE